MNRRDFLQRTGLSAVAFFLTAGNRTTAVTEKEPINVLFVLADQYRFSALEFGPNHDVGVKTPNFKKLADQGVMWTRCYAAHPRCTPNRASIMTGRFPHQTGMIDNNLMLPKDECCLAEVFQEAGYATHYIGKWHMDGVAKPGYVPRGWRRQGFATFEGHNRGHSHMNSQSFDDHGNRIEGTEGIYEPTLQTDMAIRFIEDNKDKSFFCFLSWGPPHGPCPKLERFEYNPGQLKPRPNVPNPKPGMLSRYFSNCSALDHEFGRLMAFLSEHALEQRTLVVFSADHGEMGHSHGKTAKNEPEEESSHIPLLMRLPDTLKRGEHITNLISSIDLMPTILSVCGLEVPDTCTGKDKSRAALRRGNLPDESIYIEESIKSWWRAVVKDRYKYVIYSDESAAGPKPISLFDLEKDPYEMNNLLDKPEYGEVQRAMAAELEAWRKRTADPFPKLPEQARTMYGLDGQELQEDTQEPRTRARDKRTF